MAPVSLAILGLLAYWFSVPFQRTFNVAAVGSIATLAGAVAIVGVVSQPSSLRRPPAILLVLVAGLVTVVVLGIGSAELPRSASDPYLRALGPLVTKSALLLLVATGLSWAVARRRDLAPLAGAYVVGCYVGIAGSLTNLDVVQRRGSTLRVTASEATLPNVQALVFALGVPMAAYALRHLRSPLLRIGLAAYPAAALAGILLTGSRSGLLAFALSCILLIPTFRRASVAVRAGAVALLVAAVPIVPRLLPQDPVERATSSVENDEQTAKDRDLRLNLWSHGFAVIGEHPWFGSGQGAVRQEIVDTTKFDNKFSSHNSFLNVAAEYGLVGAGLFVLVYLSVLIPVLRRPAERWYGLAILIPILVAMQVVNWEWEKANWLAIVFVGILGRREADDPVAT